MATSQSSTPSERPEGVPTHLKPGDEAIEGTTGTGEDLCEVCGGSGKLNGVPCSNCEGTGKVVHGIGGG
jgi:hypothetical protein